ncbi:helix-turn-helix domain-containing protein [Amycolatopsis sp. H20-H5]|uniref:helix-turn-helix domain-containing protein n=1 Tax=Amycolatopsis sp. H20-H5 TaxID=3046309 RepID=UPI002DBA65E3|nr:helix-turn-helix transcriptional regulator [Amycolatopsis sp. H20-H5]MEC3974776.1 helix-turn-helix transcriptional regulator [Amycolatopsis sp. H20-H5]
MQAEQSWLSSKAAAEFELNTDLLPEVLKEYRSAHGLNQADLAQILSLDQSYVSKIENGQRQVRDLEVLLRIATQLDLPPGRLGLAGHLLRPVSTPAGSALVGQVDTVQLSQTAWKRARRDLNRRRGELARAAAELYRPESRIGDAPFLARRDWIPSGPLKLDDIELEWSEGPAPLTVTGAEPEADPVLPMRAPGRRFDRYTAAIRYLDPPALFENRSSYRLLDAKLTADGGKMRFALATYFDKLDLSEAIAHELSVSTSAQGNEIRADWAELPLRSLIGDPFDLRRRALMPAIETLTLRRDRATGNATFLLHWRDPEKVATAAGIYGLIPAGEFQPSTIASRDRQNDFDLWRNMVREYSEEILGEPERDGSQAEPLDYDAWPLYRDLEKAKEDGSVTPYCLGVGLDTLTLTATILTVVVIDDHVFDTLFGAAVAVNAEGSLVAAAESSSVTDGLPFTEETVRRLTTREPMASPGACILGRAWKFREQLLRAD